MGKKYTAIVRKSRLEYVAICMELNVSARGDSLADVEKNLRTAIELYLEDLKEHPETIVSPISTEDFIEFIRDTEPEWYKEPGEGLILRPWKYTRFLLMLKIPSMSSKKLLDLLEKGGAIFVRQGATDHAIYSRVVEGKRYSAPVQMGKKTLDPVYCKRVFRQLRFTDAEIEKLLTR